MLTSSKSPDGTDLMSIVFILRALPVIVVNVKEVECAKYSSAIQAVRPSKNRKLIKAMAANGANEGFA